MLHKIIWPPSRGVGDGILRNNATVPSVKTYAWGWGYGDIRDATGFSRDGNRGCRTPTRMEQRLGDSRGDVKEMNGSVKEPNMFHNYETEKITRTASDVAENLQLYRVVRFFCPRSSCTTTHLMLFPECLPIYVSPQTLVCQQT